MLSAPVTTGAKKHAFRVSSPPAAVVAAVAVARLLQSAYWRVIRTFGTTNQLLPVSVQKGGCPFVAPVYGFTRDSFCDDGEERFLFNCCSGGLVVADNLKLLARSSMISKETEQGG
jgi:hypothetical protein